MDQLWQIKNAVERILLQYDFLRTDNPWFQETKVDWDLIIYGSTLNSVFSNESSDLDLTIMISAHHRHLEVLQSIESILKTFYGNVYSNIEVLILPSGPILQFIDKATNTSVDISINKILEIQNSRLIRTYAQLDRRFANLAVFLKIWNKKMFVDKKTRLNSYTLNLMLIAFM